MTPTVATPAPEVDVVALRTVVAADVERIWRWNCAPDVRAIAIDPSPVSDVDHRGWFERRLVAATPFWVITTDGEDVGSLRIDVRPDRHAYVAIVLAVAARGRRVGRRAIRLGAASWQRPLHAEILAENLASLHSFVAAGFVDVGQRLLADGRRLILTRWSPSDART